MTVILQPPQQRWSCPNCPATDVTFGKPNRFHRCRGLAGLLAPLVLDGSGARVLAVEREDYIAGQLVQYDGEGRPVAAVVTERPDGSRDVMVNAPTAKVVIS
jgi:hypothetical protein